jgi:hypothetical protein
MAQCRTKLNGINKERKLDKVRDTTQISKLNEIRNEKVIANFGLMPKLAILELNKTLCHSGSSGLYYKHILMIVSDNRK